MIQFRLQTIIFATFVVAVCASIIRLSPIVGCLALVPMLIAMHRTLTNPIPVKSSLCLDFVFSMSVLLGTVLASFLSLVVSSLAVGLMACHGVLRVTHSSAKYLYHRMSRSKFGRVPLACVRGITVCFAVILVFTRCGAVSLAMWLNRQILALCACWSKAPAGNGVRPA